MYFYIYLAGMLATLGFFVWATKDSYVTSGNAWMMVINSILWPLVWVYLILAMLGEGIAWVLNNRK